MMAEMQHTANQAPVGEVAGIIVGLFGLLIGGPALAFWLGDRKQR